MALHFYNGQNFSSQPIYKEDMGCDVYIYCPGPGLNDVDGLDIHVPGALSVAITTAYPKVKPDIWIGMDRPDCYHKNLIFESFTKIFRWKFHEAEMSGTKVRKGMNNYFVNVQDADNDVFDFFVNKQDGQAMTWMSQTLATAIHTVLRMGAKRIHLVGCNLGGKSDYYDDRKLDLPNKKRNANLHNNQVKMIQKLYNIGKKFGIDFISCTKESPINEYIPFIPLAEALQFTTERLNIKDHEQKHVERLITDDAKKVTKTIDWNDYLAEYGVMIVCDKEQEWLLPWWYENFHKHNTDPICIINTGMSEKAVGEWCEKTIIFELPHLEIKNWFKKPFALKLTPFKFTVYMDIDCEVRGNIKSLYAFARQGFGIGMDKPNKFSRVKNPINSGVIAYSHGNNIIDTWAGNILDNMQMFRGDQDILDMVLNHSLNGDTYQIIPNKMHRVRIQGDTDPEALIFHHTGSIGKETIKSQINGS